MLCYVFGVREAQSWRRGQSILAERVYGSVNVVEKL